MKKALLLLCALSLLLSSCATILSGSKTKVKVADGSPPNADVYYNGRYIGQAPQKIQVRKNSEAAERKIEVKAEGYKTEVIQLDRKWSVGYTILDVCFGLVPLLFDAAVGNIYKVEPKTVNYKLEKNTPTGASLE